MPLINTYWHQILTSINKSLSATLLDESKMHIKEKIWLNLVINKHGKSKIKLSKDFGLSIGNENKLNW